MKKPRLYLLDASNYIFRAFHSTNPKSGYATGLSTSSGMPTNAILVFTNMLRKLLREHDATHFATVFDVRGKKGHRHELYEEYKANRKETPDDLLRQFPYIRPISRALGTTVVEHEGWEADDVIATLARRAAEAGWEAVVVSSDKDLYQLLDQPGVSMYDGMKDAWIDEAMITKKFGVSANKVAEVQGLIGDKIDNIPGVPGVGPKTAAKLIDQYGDLEGIYEHIDEVKGKLKEKLADNKDEAFLSRTLARLKVDVPVEIALDDLVLREADADAIIPIFAELEFKALLREFQRAAKPAQETIRTVVTDADGLDAMLAAAEKATTIAAEVVRSHTDYTRAEIVGLALATSPHNSWYVPLRHHYLGMPDQLDVAATLETVAPLFTEDARSKRVGHCWKESGLLLAREGGDAFALDHTGVGFDTELASYLVNATKYAHTLENIALDLLAKKLPEAPKDVTRGRESWGQQPVDTTSTWVLSRVEAMLGVAPMLKKDLAAAELESLHDDVELPLSDVLGRMEATGIRVDPKVLQQLSERFGAKVREAEQACHEAAGEPFNLGSPKQLADVLFNKLDLPVIKRTKTGPSTDASVLEELEGRHPIIEAIHTWREMSKLKSTYTDVLPGLINERTGRIHTVFRQAVAATGRLSSFDPNLQNIPIRTEEGRRIRDAFVPADGCVLVSADYSQVELRVLAHLCNDPGLQKAFRDNVDIHRRTASEVLGVPEDEITYEQRSAAKAINFGLMYGMGAFRLARDLKISRAEAQGYIDRYFDRFSAVKDFMDRTIEEGREQGYVSTLLGRRRYVPELSSRNFNRRAGAERVAINTPVQGTAADIIKLAMLRVDEMLKQRGTKARMLLQVHDELVFDVPEAEADSLSAAIKTEMESVVTLDVPLVVEVAHGQNWNEAH